MTERSVVHSTFVVERSYDATPAEVFAAFADKASKRRWFIEGEGWHIESYEMDFRPGGVESSVFRFGDGPMMRNDAVYQDIVENERIVSAYSMMIGENRISASLATIELKPEGKKTKLVYTEQGAFLDGHDNVQQRQEGCGWLFDQLTKELAGRRKAA
jgi:uncharacterized protein YndB with AHSA1/START domain